MERRIECERGFDQFRHAPLEAPRWTCQGGRAERIPAFACHPRAERGKGRCGTRLSCVMPSPRPTCFWPAHTHTLSHSHTHSLSHTYTPSLTYSFSVTRTHISPSLSQTHTITHTLTHTLTITHSLTHTHNHTHSLTHTHNHSLSLKNSHGNADSRDCTWPNTEPRAREVTVFTHPDTPAGVKVSSFSPQSTCGLRST